MAGEVIWPITFTDVLSSLWACFCYQWQYGPIWCPQTNIAKQISFPFQGKYNLKQAVTYVKQMLAPALGVCSLTSGQTTFKTTQENSEIQLMSTFYQKINC